MPDESCRKCGKPLYFFAKCVECKSVIQEICLKCGTKTEPRYHNCDIKPLRFLFVEYT